MVLGKRDVMPTVFYSKKLIDAPALYNKCGWVSAFFPRARLDMRKIDEKVS